MRNFAAAERKHIDEIVARGFTDMTPDEVLLYADWTAAIAEEKAANDALNDAIIQNLNRQGEMYSEQARLARLQFEQACQGIELE